MELIVAAFFSSHPSRVRGLKSIPFVAVGIARMVAPFTGAWIEIIKRCVIILAEIVSHPSRVRGLKYVLRPLREQP